MSSNKRESLWESGYTKSLWEASFTRGKWGPEAYSAAPISRLSHLNISVETLIEKAKDWETGYPSIPYLNTDKGAGEWVYFSSNEHLTEAHLAAFRDKLDWHELSLNLYLKITPELLVKYADTWDWRILCKRPDFIYDFETLTLIKDRLNWESLLKNEFFLKQCHSAIERLL